MGFHHPNHFMILLLIWLFTGYSRYRDKFVRVPNCERREEFVGCIQKLERHWFVSDARSGKDLCIGIQRHPSWALAQNTVICFLAYWSTHIIMSCQKAITTTSGQFLQYLFHTILDHWLRLTSRQFVLTSRCLRPPFFLPVSSILLIKAFRTSFKTFPIPTGLIIKKTVARKQKLKRSWSKQS